MVLVGANGERVVLEPGESGVIKEGVVYRVACNDCGLADGSHETWCPLWKPYDAPT